MAEVTPELMFEVLRAVQARLAQVDGKVDELKQEMQALRTSQISILQEISAMHATLVRHEGRLDRIERRLELDDVTTSPQ
jgi:cell division protein ZapA (FtsZ GTPase activity inhibitor)